MANGERGGSVACTIGPRPLSARKWTVRPSADGPAAAFRAGPVIRQALGAIDLVEAQLPALPVGAVLSVLAGAFRGGLGRGSLDSP